VTAIDDIKQHYEEVIDAMPNEFNSHKFILELARRHQKAYIRLLAHYTDSPSPFMVAHGQLAKLIGQFDDKVTPLDYEDSADIFGNSNKAMLWRKK